MMMMMMIIIIIITIPHPLAHGLGLVLLQEKKQMEAISEGRTVDDDDDEERLTDLQVESLVVIEMLCDYKPSLQQDLAKSREALGR
jgi:hypothetical protein